MYSRQVGEIKMRLISLASATAAVLSYQVPNVPLKNSAAPNQLMPAIGLGTGGYSSAAAGFGVYPECWSDSNGCAAYVLNATTQWLQMASQGGVNPIRIDNANTYGDVGTIGLAMKQSGVPRSQIFLLSKVGSGQPMGYNDTLNQMASILQTQQVSYVDALLIHWPTATSNSTEPACQMGTPTYNATLCRLETWRAMVDIFHAGQALAIGVSNYNKSEIEEIVSAGMPLPAINQIPIHIYRSSSQSETIEYCQRMGITVNAYSPLGVPDWHVFPSEGGMAATPLQDPVVQSIATARGKTGAQIMINWLWQQGIVTNPRTVQAAHMDENLSAYAFDLTDAEVALLNSRPQDWCSVDPSMYECAPDNIGPAISRPWLYESQ